MSTLLERVIAYKFGEKLSKNEEMKLAFDFYVTSDESIDMPRFLYDAMRRISYGMCRKKTNGPSDREIMLRNTTRKVTRLVMQKDGNIIVHTKPSKHTIKNISRTIKRIKK